MKTLITLMILAVAVISFAGTTPGRDLRGYQPLDSGAPEIVHISTGLSAAKADTIDIFGGPDRGDGKFQSDADRYTPDWEGWTSVDLTARTNEIWHIDTFNSPTGTAAMWCGEVFTSCGVGDPAEGYGNNYQEMVGWTGTVVDNGAVTNVTMVFDINMDTEPGYDYLYLKYETPSGWTTAATYNLWTYDNETHSWVPRLGETISFTVAPGDLVGPASNEVHLVFEAQSDGAWSDEDCMWPTSGHTQIDNISVSGSNGLPATLDDFESGMAASNWQLEFPQSVGDFAKIWPHLTELDPCRENRSCQVAFIDDGVVVPCTGGTLGTNWTYGPGSYTHNLTGGCAGPTEHARNEIWSPAVEYADGAGNPLHATHEGAFLEFDVYEHLPINNGMFWVWHVSASDDGGLTWSPWQDRNFVYYGFTEYKRAQFRIDDLMLPGTTHIRIALGINELGFVWGLNGTDGTPAPYFDNVRVRAFEIDGPFIAGVERDMPQDAFPASGTLDFATLGANSIRFDMAKNIDTSGTAIVAGDSVMFDIAALRTGAALTRKPRLYFQLDANPLFDPYRLHPVSGYVEGDSLSSGNSYYTPTDRYAFDLPDEGFFFPGDVIHYYIEAVDDAGGDVRTATLPESLAGFGVFPGDPGFRPLIWPLAFTVRGLPTMIGATPGDQPPILFYNDYGALGGENEWWHAFDHLGMVEGVDYDVYTTNAPTLSSGNGLAGRATVDQIQHYETLLYSSGDLTQFTLTTPDPYNWGGALDADDVGLLGNWLQLGRNALFTGDHLLHDLVTNQGSAGISFASTWLSCQYATNDVATLIGDQQAPLVSPLSGNSAGLTQEFVGYGWCPNLSTFDGAAVQGSALAVAEWTGAGGVSGVYPTYAAGTLNELAGSKIVFFPMDFQSWWSTPDFTPPPAFAPQATARDVALAEILTFFGNGASGIPTDVNVPAVAQVRAYPNPFNPSTTIEYSVPNRSAVALRVYNVRGELVRVLVDGMTEPGIHRVAWNGMDDTNRHVASGVYFTRTSVGDRTFFDKLTLTK